MHHFFDVTISEVDILCLLVGCTALESFLLEGIHSFRSIRVVSPNLRDLGVSGMSMFDPSPKVFQELVIEDAPCLERLVVFGLVAQRAIRVLSAPKLTAATFMSANSSEVLTAVIRSQVEYSPSSS